MADIVLRAMEEIEKLAEDVPAGKHIVTGDLRRLSARLFRELKGLPIGAVLPLCEALLEKRAWAPGVIAFDWAYRLRAQYTADVYDVFYRWLKAYVRGWGDCDDFCTHAFGELLRQNPALFARVLTWTADSDFWVRRASAVVLIPSILKEQYKGLNPYEISDALMTDPHDLVQKGYGWMLKCLSQVEPESVRRYLTAHHAVMPRTAYRCALEKFDPQTRKALMEL
ncbi:MAG: DNA alkylation repair protein [Hominenteromicrobium sp.]